MKTQLALAFVVATAPAAFVQAPAQTAAQTPAQPATQAVEATPPMTSAGKAKPSAAIPMHLPTDAPDQPAAVSMSAAQPASPDAPSTAQTQPAAAVQPAATAQPGDDEFKPFKPYPGTEATLHTHAAAVDPDAGIVTEVIRRPGELPAGTTIRARLRAAIDTQSTSPDTPFAAELSEDVRDGDRVLLPAGAVIEGTITQARGGRRFRGTALIHLQAQRIVMPDGTSHPMMAQVIDTDQYAETRIDNEGNIVRRDHAGATLAAMSLTTGSAAAAGAVLGGGVGALIGAGIGAGLSTAVWLKADRQARLPQDTLVVFILTDAMDLNQPRPDFVENPAMTPAPAKAETTTVSSAPGALAPTAPAGMEPQAFVPSN